MVSTSLHRYGQPEPFKSAPSPRPGSGSRLNTPSPTPLKFQGNNGMLSTFANPLSQAMIGLEQSPLKELAFQDFICYIIPQLSLVRTKQEFKDVAPMSFMLLGVTISFMLLLPKLLMQPVKALTGLSSEALGSELKESAIRGATDLFAHVPLKEKLGRLAVAGGFLFPFGAGFMAVPFIKNLLTLKRTKTANFEEIIGLRKQGEVKAKRSYEEEVKYQRNRAVGILGGGLGLGLASLAFFTHFARKPNPAEALKWLDAGANAIAKLFKKSVEPGGVINSLFDKFALRGTGSNEVKGRLSVLLFWLLPPYIGMVWAGRGKNEKIEQFIRSANSITWFSFLTPAVNRVFFVNKFKDLLPQQYANGTLQGIPDFKTLVPMVEKLEPALKDKVIQLKNNQTIASYLLPFAMLSITPILLNRFFTKWRVEREKAAELKNTASLPNPINSPTNPQSNFTVQRPISDQWPSLKKTTPTYLDPFTQFRGQFHPPA